jgi:hypothetical protein
MVWANEKGGTFRPYGLKRSAFSHLVVKIKGALAGEGSNLFTGVLA